jgi:hypothetical protein
MMMMMMMTIITITTTTTTIGAGVAQSVVSDYGLDDQAIEGRSPAEAKGIFL